MAFTQKAAGTQIAAYDTTNPFQQLTIGEGAPGRLWVIEDMVSIATTTFASTNDFVRLCRFPSNAIIKKVELFTDKSLVDGGSSSSALVLSVGVIFSDSTLDGTPLAYQNQHPTTVGIGGGTTTAGTTVAIGGSSANYIFGTITALSSTGSFSGGTVYNLSTSSTVMYGGEITWGGSEATYGTPLAITQQPLINLFNLRDGQNNLIPKLGMMDLIVQASTAYNTAPSAKYNMYGRVSYILG